LHKNTTTLAWVALRLRALENLRRIFRHSTDKQHLVAAAQDTHAPLSILAGATAAGYLERGDAPGHVLHDERDKRNIARVLPHLCRSPQPCTQAFMLHRIDEFAPFLTSLNHSNPIVRLTDKSWPRRCAKRAAEDDFFEAYDPRRILPRRSKANKQKRLTKSWPLAPGKNMWAAAPSLTAAISATSVSGAVRINASTYLSIRETVVCALLGNFPSQRGHAPLPWAARRELLTLFADLAQFDVLCTQTIEIILLCMRLLYGWIVQHDPVIHTAINERFEWQTAHLRTERRLRTRVLAHVARCTTNAQLRNTLFKAGRAISPRPLVKTGLFHNPKTSFEEMITTQVGHLVAMAPRSLKLLVPESVSKRIEEAITPDTALTPFDDHWVKLLELSPADETCVQTAYADFCSSKIEPRILKHVLGMSTHGIARLYVLMKRLRMWRMICTRPLDVRWSMQQVNALRAALSTAPDARLPPLAGSVFICPQCSTRPGGSIVSHRCDTDIIKQMRSRRMQSQPMPCPIGFVGVVADIATVDDAGLAADVYYCRRCHRKAGRYEKMQRVQAIGNIIVVQNVPYVLCPRCATLSRYDASLIRSDDTLYSCRVCNANHGTTPCATCEEPAATHTPHS